jgi:hypothetical protein
MRLLTDLVAFTRLGTDSTNCQITRYNLLKTLIYLEKEELSNTSNKK